MSDNYDNKSPEYFRKRREHNKYVNSGAGEGEAAKQLRRLKAKQGKRDGAGKGDQAGVNPGSRSYLNACYINELYERGEIDLDTWRQMIKENK